MLKCFVSDLSEMEFSLCLYKWWGFFISLNLKLAELLKVERRLKQSESTALPPGSGTEFQPAPDVAFEGVRPALGWFDPHPSLLHPPAPAPTRGASLSAGLKHTGSARTPLSELPLPHPPCHPAGPPWNPHPPHPEVPSTPSTPGHLTQRSPEALATSSSSSQHPQDPRPPHPAVPSTPGTPGHLIQWSPAPRGQPATSPSSPQHPQKPWPPDPAVSSTPRTPGHLTQQSPAPPGPPATSSSGLQHPQDPRPPHLAVPSTPRTPGHLYVLCAFTLLGTVQNPSLRRLCSFTKGVISSRRYHKSLTGAVSYKSTLIGVNCTVLL